MVTSISLALGLIIGEAIVELFTGIANLLFKSRNKDNQSKTLKPSDRSQLTTRAMGAENETISQDSLFTL